MLPRFLMFALLLTNIGVGVWWYLQPHYQPRIHAQGEPAVAMLELLSEAELRQQPPAPEAELAAAPEPAVASAQWTCERIGPFLTQADLRRAVNALTPVVQQIQFQETRALARRGYWVFLPARSNRDAALAVARELSAKGLRDYYVVTSGERENTVSLGVFRELDNARKRLAEVQGMGFAAELAERNEDVPNYWIDIAVNPGFAWHDHLGGYAGVSAAERDCGSP